MLKHSSNSKIRNEFNIILFILYIIYIRLVYLAIVANERILVTFVS